MGNTRSTRRRRAAVSVVALMVAGLVAPDVGPASAACDISPQLRDITANQGVGSYATLARGKQTLVRLYLSLPSCAPSDASIAVTGTSLTADNGSGLSLNLSPFSPAPSVTPPAIVPYAQGPAPNSAADPKFVLPGSYIAPTPTTRFDVTFHATVNYQAKASSGAAPVAGTKSFDTLSGSLAPLKVSVEKKTNALRLLVVPMGDARQTYASQFSAIDKTTTQKGLTNLARLLPVPDATGDLKSLAGGVRYTITPTLLDVSSLKDPTTGKFCGKSTNWATLKPLLSQFLQSWNTANAANPAATADRVLGVVSENVSLGASSSCAEGYATVGGNQAWVRAIVDTATVPSMTGALMAMEIGHTLGAVPANRDDDFNARHSLNIAADGTAPNRGYNVAKRAFVSDDRSAMKLSSGAWNNTNVLFEPADWAFMQCKLGGATNAECTTAGTVGTAVGVGADPTFVISGRTDGTADGTDIVESYFAPGVARTDIDPFSTYRLAQRDGATILRDDGVEVAFEESDHDSAAAGQTSPVGVFSAAFPFDTGANSIELWKGQPDGPTSVLLYSRNRTLPPQLSTLEAQAPTVGAVGTQRVSVDSSGGQATGGSDAPSFSADGRFVAFRSSATNLVPGDTNGQPDIFVRDRQSGTTERVSLTNTGAQSNRASGTPVLSGDGRYVAFNSAGNLVPADTNTITDVYVRDRVGATTERMSVSTGGVGGNDTSTSPSISADGNLVVFHSLATNLASGDVPAENEVFVHDRQAGTTGRVSVTTSGGAGQGGFAAISADGRFVAFQAHATNLVTGDTNGQPDVFVRDLTAGTTERVSLSDTEAQGNNISQQAAISADGAFVAFRSTASNLVAGDTNARDDIFVRGRSAGTTERVSIAGAGTQGDGDADFPAISADARYVAFTSTATNMVANDTNGMLDVFRRDRETGTTERISVDSAGNQTSAGSDTQGVSYMTADGRLVVFFSTAANLVGGDTNGVSDVFAHDQAPPAPGQQAVTFKTTDDFPDDVRASLLYTCPDGTIYPVAVGLRPEALAGATASFERNFDAALACEGGTLNAAINDGFTRVTPDPINDTPVVSGPKAPTAATETPAGPADVVSQFDSVALKGSGKDPETGELTGSALEWSLTVPGGSPTVVGTGATVDLAPPLSGWAPGTYAVRLKATDPAGATNTEDTSFRVRVDCRRRVCSNGNPSAPGVVHPVTLSKPVSLRVNKPDPCSTNYGPTCTDPPGSATTVSAPAFAGDPGAAFEVMLCNAQALAEPNADGSGGGGDVLGGCDYGNGVGLGPLGVPNSGSLNLDAGGNLSGNVNLEMPSGATLTPFGGGPATNPAAVCPPTTAQIAAGWTCIVHAAEYDPAHAEAPPLEASYRQVFLKSPIPAMTCGGGACPPSIPTGTSVTLNGVQFPCRTIIPDDPTTIAYDGACTGAWTTKTILLKRVSTALIEGSAIVPTSQTAALNGGYTITFTMPAVAAPGETYKIVPHSPACTFPCESGQFNAAGKFFRHA